MAAVVSVPGIGATDIAPFLSIKGTLVENENAFATESGEVVTVAPGVRVSATGARSSLSMNYQFNAVRSHGLDQDDRDIHQLDLRSSYRHSPGKWTSFASVSSRLTNIDIDGVQNIDPVFAGENTTELRTLALSTELRDRITAGIQYTARLRADYAEFENSGSFDGTADSQGYGAFLGLDNNPSPDRLTWNASVNSSFVENDASDAQIDVFRINLDYKINPDLSTFLDATDTRTDSSDLNQEQVLVGLWWKLTSRSSIRAGAGRLGDDESYTFDANFSAKRYSAAFSYKEEIIIVRDDVFVREGFDPLGSVTTSESLSIDPVVQKRATLNLRASGKYTSVGALLFYTDRSNPNTDTDEIVDGVNLSLTRKLTARDNLSLGLLTQQSEKFQDNRLNDLTISYNRNHSRYQSFAVTLGWAEQDSTSIASEYERAHLSAEYRLTF